MAKKPEGMYPTMRQLAVLEVKERHLYRDYVPPMVRASLKLGGRVREITELEPISEKDEEKPEK